jgi:ribulose-phosphate 3-epimerase
MDGHFVPNLTFGPLVIAAIRGQTHKVFDVHLMISNPDLYIEDYAKAGADIITVHAEACTHLHRTLQSIRALGKKAGVALNPATPISAIEHVMDLVDMILIMTVNPGFGGQSYIALEDKIRKARDMAMAQNRPIDIEVDGGITDKTAPLVTRAGANVLVAGTYIFKHEDSYTQAIKDLRAAS